MSEFDHFDLDPNRLDEEWVSQPRLFWEAARKLADAKAAYERAKAARDVEKAELDRSIRKHPEDYGITKITEGAIEQLIIIQKTYKRANEDVIKAKHTVDILEADVRSLEHRKTALETLAKLWVEEYYSEPRPPKKNRDAIEEMERRVIFGKIKSKT